MTAPKSFRVVVSQKHVKIKTSHYTSYQSSVKRKQKKSNIVDVHKQTDQASQTTSFRKYDQKRNYTDLQNYQMDKFYSKVGFL